MHPFPGCASEKEEKRCVDGYYLSCRWWSPSVAYPSFGASPRSAQASWPPSGSARRLNELNALRSDFSAMIAHELDTPMASVRKLNELLSAQGEDPEVRDYATTATERELDALTNLVREVRAVAAVEREDFGIQARPLPLEELLAAAEVYASTLPGHHPIEVMVRGDLRVGERVLADPERIAQVLRNLLSNAAKYSPEGTPIELRVDKTEGWVRIEVADHGRGIHPDDVPRIFEKFGRGRDRKGHERPGVGLGLYLSRRIVQSHGSELTVQTRVGEGSVFGFELRVE